MMTGGLASMAVRRACSQPIMSSLTTAEGKTSKVVLCKTADSLLCRLYPVC